MKSRRKRVNSVSLDSYGWNVAANYISCISMLLLLSAGILFGSVTSASGELATECGNESLRALLGDTLLSECRAYEMVSPAYKEGYPLLVKSLAADGESAIIYGLGTLYGNPGSGETAVQGALYSAKRTTRGWRLAPLNAPLSEFVGQIPISQEADNGDTLWKQHTPTQPASERGLYMRSADGRFRYIGPLGPPRSGSGSEASNLIDLSPFNIDQPIAATDDYSHVVLVGEYAESRWPFDETPVSEAQNSLYEYSGSGNNEPLLVGVEGQKGSRQLIALCGTVLGSGLSGSSYNALSKTGETIFFTVNPCTPGPATSEIYARLHGALTSAAEAVTIDISTSQCTLACGTAKSGKNFEGASEDGTRVFFTSTQKLTDDAVDGTSSGSATEGSGCASLPEAEGGCSLYMYDFNEASGSRLSVVSPGGEVLGVLGIAEDGSRIYFVSRTAIVGVGKNPYDQAPLATQPNLYMYDVASRSTTFIATLSTGDAANWSRVFSRTAEVAGKSGEYLLFASTMPNVTPDDTSSISQLFEYKAETGHEGAELVRITKGENGYNDNGNGVEIGIRSGTIETVAAQLGYGSDFKSTTNRLNVSADGRTVFFETAGQLSPWATSASVGCTSLYEFHASGPFLEGSLSLVSDGRDTQLFKGATCGAQLLGVDNAGANVLFGASDDLVPDDVDAGQRDIYDARVNGGFIPERGGDSCHIMFCEGASSAPPPLAEAGSTTGAGEPPIVAAGATQSTKPNATRSTRRDSKHVRARRRGRLGRSLKSCRRKARRHKPTACKHPVRHEFGASVKSVGARRGR